MTAIHTPRELLIRGMTTSTTSISITARVPTITEPTTSDGNYVVFDAGHNHSLLRFFGEGDTNYTGYVQVWLWFVCNGPTNHLWVPQRVGEFQLTMAANTLNGVADSPLVATEYLIDTIAATAGYDDTVAAKIYSPADDNAGYILLDTLGARKVEVQFDRDAGAGTSMTNMNCLYQKL